MILAGFDIIENYDSIKRTVDDKGKPQFTNAYLDKEMKPAPLITYEKRVDGHIYVVEAVADTSKKEVRVLSAYMNTAKKEKSPYTANANAPALTSDNAYTDASINNIPEFSAKSNYTGTRIRSNITQKEYNIPQKKELDIKRDTDGAVGIKGQVGEIDEIKIEPLHGTYPEKDMDLLEADSITNNIPEPSAKINDNTEISDEPGSSTLETPKKASLNPQTH